MDDMKYIIIDKQYGSLSPFIFPPFINHDYMLRKLKEPGDELWSAGFVHIEPNGTVCCHGKSVTLKVGVDAMDNNIIKKRLFYSENFL